MIMSVATALLQAGNDSADSTIYTHSGKIFASNNSDFLLSVQKLFVVPCFCMELRAGKQVHSRSSNK
jgi:hypothetical protein